MCLTADIWTDGSTRSFLGITAHIPTDTHNQITTPLQSVLLSFQRCQGTQIGEQICDAFEDVIKEYDIKNKIDFIIKDDTGCMKTAFRVRLPCDSKVLEEVPVDVDLLDWEDNAEDDTIWQDLDEEDNDVICSTFERHSNSKKLLPCFAHSLQLVISDGMVEATCAATIITKARLMAALYQDNLVFMQRFVTFSCNNFNHNYNILFKTVKEKVHVSLCDSLIELDSE